LPQAKNSKEGRAEKTGETRLSKAALPAGGAAALWRQIRAEAAAAAAADAVMRPFLRHFILDQPDLRAALMQRLVERLHHKFLDKQVLLHNCAAVFAGINESEAVLAADLAAVYVRDPATKRLLEPLLYYKGFHALQTHRIAHALWQAGRRDFALYLQSRSSSVFQTDIHPAAQIGRGVILDHATGLVIGATAVVEDNVTLLHEVTLGGTSKTGGDRHPKIRPNVLIGAGAKILGNIEVGEGAKLAANAVILQNVPPYATMAGVPGRIMARAGEASSRGGAKTGSAGGKGKSRA